VGILSANLWFYKRSYGPGQIEFLTIRAYQRVLRNHVCDPPELGHRDAQSFSPGGASIMSSALSRDTTTSVCWERG